MGLLRNGERLEFDSPKYWEYYGSKTGFNDMSQDVKTRRETFKQSW